MSFVRCKSTFSKTTKSKIPLPNCLKNKKNHTKKTKKQVFVFFLVFLLKPEWKVEIKNTNSHVFEVENACQQWENLYICDEIWSSSSNMGIEQRIYGSGQMKKGGP